MQVTYTLRLKDLLLMRDMQYALRKKGQAILRARGVVATVWTWSGLFLPIPLMVDLLHIMNHPVLSLVADLLMMREALAVFLCISAIYGAFLAVMNTRLIRSFCTNPAYRGQRTIILTPTGPLLQNAARREFLWEDIARIMLTKDAVYITFKQKVAIIVPARALAGPAGKRAFYDHAAALFRAVVPVTPKPDPADMVWPPPPIMMGTP